MKIVKIFLYITIGFILFGFVTLFINELMIRAMFWEYTDSNDIAIVDNIIGLGGVYLLCLPVKLFIAQVILSWFYGKSRFQKWNIGHSILVLLIGIACSFLPYLLLGYV